MDLSRFFARLSTALFFGIQSQPAIAADYETIARSDVDGQTFVVDMPTQDFDFLKKNFVTLKDGEPDAHFIGIIGTSLNGGGAATADKLLLSTATDLVAAEKYGIMVMAKSFVMIGNFGSPRKSIPELNLHCTDDRAGKAFVRTVHCEITNQFPLAPSLPRVQQKANLGSPSARKDFV